MTYEINIFNESSVKRLPKKRVKDVIIRIFKDHDINLCNLNIIYLNDAGITELNKDFLKHDYVTDVISFLLDKETMDGEIYIGALQAKRQAKEYMITLSNEIIRLAAHGALHLVGYDDETAEAREKMHELENKYIFEI